ncbi:MAG: hypothetical protein RLZZ210_1838 [Pseudomonadota bacterium]|jgi:hypothetical protein
MLVDVFKYSSLMHKVLIMNNNIEDKHDYKMTYAKCIFELTQENLLEGLLGFGLFAEKIVPIFTSESFFDFYKNKNHQSSTLCEKTYTPKKFIEYLNIRNINIPRILSIPHPIAYAQLCKVICDKLEDIQKHFKENTENHKHKISKIHIRKFKNEKYVFRMNYKQDEDYTEPELLVGKKFLVKADISNCFPSIYTHSIPWALVGKEKAKKDRDDRTWYNKIDVHTRKIKNDETNGLLIGSHAFNLISEIILVRIDNILRVFIYR